MSGNADQFSRDVLSELQAEKDRHRKLVGLAALTALQVTVERSQVDEGTMRNSWQLVETPEDAAERNERLGEKGDPPSVSQLNRAQHVIEQAKPFSPLFVVNPLDYPQYVDEDYPMVDPAIEAADAILRANDGGRILVR